MIVFRGLGPLVLFIMAGMQVLTWLLCDWLNMMEHVHYAYGIPTGCVVGAIITWFVGRRLNRNPEGEVHDLYDIRMEYWGIIFTVIALFLWYRYLP